eukprot:1254_1
MVTLLSFLIFCNINIPFSDGATGDFCALQADYLHSVQTRYEKEMAEISQWERPLFDQKNRDTHFNSTIHCPTINSYLGMDPEISVSQRLINWLSGNYHWKSNDVNSALQYNPKHYEDHSYLSLHHHIKNLIEAVDYLYLQQQSKQTPNPHKWLYRGAVMKTDDINMLSGLKPGDNVPSNIMGDAFTSTSSDDYVANAHVCINKSWRTMFKCGGYQPVKIFILANKYGKYAVDINDYNYQYSRGKLYFNEREWIFLQNVRFELLDRASFRCPNLVYIRCPDDLMQSGPAHVFFVKPIGIYNQKLKKIIQL